MKKIQKFVCIKFFLYLCKYKQENNKQDLKFVSWCNGSTMVFGAISQGSNPCETTVNAEMVE